MSKPKKTANGVWAGCALAVLSVCHPGISVGQELDESSRAVEQLQEQISGQIRVGGAVLDGDTGTPLGRVRMSVTVGRFDPERPEMRSADRHKEEVTGAFRFDCVGCTDVRLRLSKTGYESRTLSFSVAAVDGNVVNETQLQVTLRPLEEPVVLRRLEGELVAAADEDRAKVLAVSVGNLKARSVGVGRVPRKADGSFSAVKLTASFGADGKANTVDIAEPKAAHSPVTPVHARPVEAALDFSGLGGVIRHQPDDLSNPRAALRFMRRAPKDGYTATLELGRQKDPVFFYVQIGERYGKGYVEAPWIDHSGRVRAHVRLWMNDGGESLESAYE